MEAQDIRRQQNLLRYDYAHGKISAHEYDTQMNKLQKLVEKHQPVMKLGIPGMLL